MKELRSCLNLMTNEFETFRIICLFISEQLTVDFIYFFGSLN